MRRLIALLALGAALVACSPSGESVGTTSLRQLAAPDAGVTCYWLDGYPVGLSCVRVR